jgi:hypothetical protein
LASSLYASFSIPLTPLFLLQVDAFNFPVRPYQRM